ncbi:S-adenosyl-L-methionine-dependent methyltransferase [Lyophyllum atratum]|nr:S-adenosyl-L-methionine-dependent methyltransferase [Lyophyllum atratum]
MTSPIRQLLKLISDSVDKLEAACDASGCPVPDLYTPFAPPSEAFRADPVAAEAANIISAAALQLEATLTPPHVSLYHVVSGHFKSAALRVCLESSVTEILREAGPEGLHVNEIGAKNGQDPRKLARFLRCLAVQHVYREVTPDVFANTRISSMMDTLKPSKDVIAHPETKHDDTPGLAALAGHHLDEPFKGSAFAWETLADPATAKSGDPAASPFARAFGNNETLWQLHARDEIRARRFNTGMDGMQKLQPVNAILKAYEWKDLPNGSVIVDVGGGIGSSSLIVAREFPHLKYVVQDLPSVIEDAKKYWKINLPDAKVTLEVQDFFKPQPKDRSVSIFLLKMILHDWSDEYCVKFLSQLRAVAKPDTKLLLIESLVPFACHDPGNDDNKGIPGSVPHEAPAPLLANYGAVNELSYSADIDMFLLFNSQERTIRHFDELLLSTGWKVKLVRRQEGDSTFLQSIEAIPTEIPKL